jgi:Holliday junction resolvasome RuvABC endonuclease subunit
MFLDLAKCIDEARPDYLSVEAVQQQTNPKAVMILSNLQGGLICHAYERGIPVSSPLPTEWRKILGFRQGPKVKREELKAQSINFVLQHFGITASEDECEAICIGIAEYLRLNDLDVSNL